MTLDFFDKLFLTNLFEHIPAVYSYLLCCLGAIFSGVIVGKEREKAQKAAGLRTFAMVALGSCVFTLTSRLIIEQQLAMDGARIPAQIVSGVGFLGAGAVFRSGRVINGLTTAAGIWATAAVGLVFGLGFFVLGLCVTFMIFILFWTPSYLDKRSLIEQERNIYHIHIDSMSGKGPVLIHQIFTDWGHPIEIISQQDTDIQVWRARLALTYKPHQRFLSELANLSYVAKIELHPVNNSSDLMRLLLSKSLPEKEKMAEVDS